MKSFLTILLLSVLGLNAQIKGVVTDSETGNPVAYANIYADDSRWISADENGEFTIAASQDETLSISAVGYSKVVIKTSNAAHIKLKPEATNIEQVTVIKMKLTLESTLGEFNRDDLDMNYTTKGTPQILARYFAPSPLVRETPFFKTVVIGTKSTIKNAKFNVHIFEVNPDGTPGDDLAPENIIGTAKKGNRNTEIDLTRYRIRVPENGFFIGLEWLIIPENRDVVASGVLPNGASYEDVEYMPLFATYRTQSNTSWGFQQNYKWREFKKVSPERIAKYYEDFKKATGKDAPPFDDRYSEFAVKLTLTN